MSKVSITYLVPHVEPELERGLEPGLALSLLPVASYAVVYLPVAVVLSAVSVGAAAQSAVVLAAESR